MNGHRCAICFDQGRFKSTHNGEWVDCPRCFESGDIAPARAPGLAAPVRGRQVPPLGPLSTAHIDAILGRWQGEPSRPSDTPARDPFSLVDDDEPEQPSWQRRHDDVCPIKRARWEGGVLGLAIGMLLMAAAVAWRDYGTLLP